MLISTGGGLGERIVLIILFVASCCSIVAGIQTEVIEYCNSTISSEGSKGVCVGFDKRLKNCPPLLKLLREKKFEELRKEFCDDESSGPRFELSSVCCPGKDLIDLDGQKHQFAKHPNFHLLPNPGNSLCGLSGNSDRIIGGEDAQPGYFPWVARIAVKDHDDEAKFTCGASIISKRYLLTAAHCFHQEGLKVEKVRIGDTHDDEVNECIQFGDVSICEQEEDYGVEALIVHENYTGDTSSPHDIALIRLNRDIKNVSSLFVRPICLPFVEEFQIQPLQISSPDAKGLPAIVAGWGKLYNSDHEGSPDLQYLAVPVTDYIKCGKAYRRHNITLTDDQICAGGKTGQGSCAGDSGGPLFYPTKTKGRAGIRNYQIGVVSYGNRQCATGTPVVYTRVSKHLTWILNNIKP